MRIWLSSLAWTRNSSDGSAASSTHSAVSSLLSSADMLPNILSTIVIRSVMSTVGRCDEGGGGETAATSKSKSPVSAGPGARC